MATKYRILKTINLRAPRTEEQIRVKETPGERQIATFKEGTEVTVDDKAKLPEWERLAAKGIVERVEDVPAIAAKSEEKKKS